MSPRLLRFEAASMLLFATLFWSLSFPIMKVMGLVQSDLLPGVSSWFISSLCILYRFAAAALFMLLWTAPKLRSLTRLEVEQGLGLGLFGSAGLLFQMDGLAYTSASTSAFLTQGYCLLIPLWLAISERRWPSLLVMCCCALVLAGVAVLAQFDWRTFRLGRGELETLIASVLFTGQILWLQRPKYASNDVSRFTLVMFVVMAVGCVPLALATTREPADWWRAFRTPPLLAMLGVLVFVCTFGGYLLMNRWQPFLPATQAGLIYCAEPVGVSVLVLFLPAWLGRYAGVNYPNEELTWRLLTGGGLVTLANVLITLAPLRPAKGTAQPTPAAAPEPPPTSPAPAVPGRS